MEIDRYQKVQFKWTDISQIIITKKKNIIGLLYNIEREAIVFTLKSGQEHYLLLGRGIRIKDMNEFLIQMKQYVSDGVIEYVGNEHFSHMLAMNPKN